MEKTEDARTWRNPLEDFLGYQLRRASTVMMAHLAATLGDIGLRPTEASVLMLIDENSGCTQSDLGRALGIKRANMVPLMARLGQRDLVERAPVDGRSHALSLTPAGKLAVREVRRKISAHEELFQSMFDVEGRGFLLEALRSIRANEDAGED